MKRVVVHSKYGDIVLALDESKAPASVDYFCKGVESGLYKDAHFYRVVRKNPVEGELPSIDILQGGMGWDKCSGITGPPLETTRQTGLRHTDGVISLARSEPCTSSPEFFICIGDQPKLDYAGTSGAGHDGFAAFGVVEQGMEIVHRIHKLPANSLPPDGNEMFRNEFLDDTVKLELKLVPAVRNGKKQK